MQDADEMMTAEKAGPIGFDSKVGLSETTTYIPGGKTIYLHLLYSNIDRMVFARSAFRTLVSEQSTV